MCFRIGKLFLREMRRARGVAAGPGVGGRRRENMVGVNMVLA